MEREWHTLHRIEEVSYLISLLREYETNTITRNTVRCNNRDDLLNLSFHLKIPNFSEVYLPSWTYMVQHFFWENRQWVLTKGVIQETNLVAARGKSSKPNPSEVSFVQLGGLGGTESCPSQGCFGAELS